MVKGCRWVLKHPFQGHPKRSDFDLVEDDLGDLKQGEVVYEAEFLSVDPYQRAYVGRFPASAFPMTMIGSTVVKVTESKNAEWPVGTRAVCYAGWVKRGKCDPSKDKEPTPGGGAPVMNRVPDLPAGLSPSLLLGAVGMPGNTAYFGLLELCQPKKGETVLVNGAAGAVGSLVGQIAKVKGCRVIGYAGTDDKVQWLKDLGFDEAFNYKKISMADSLKKAAPNGVDCFFDNVGGEDSTTVMNHMNLFGRIAVCGAIASYNNTGGATVCSSVQGAVVTKQLRMEGFIVRRWMDRWLEGLTQMAKWIAEGKVKARETVVQGFDKAPEALAGLFTGDNTGKMIVKV